MKLIHSVCILLVSALIPLCVPRTALAWGVEGHKVICCIAESYLTPVAEEQIKDILGGKTLSDEKICCWPDIIRGNKDYTAIYPGNGHWHYVDFDVAKHYDENFKLSLPEDGQNIVAQLERWQKELAASDTPLERRLDALRFVVHFAGDIHQPMHCAYRYGDMGGNMIPVHSFAGKHYSFDADTPMDYEPNLHSLWDEYLVKELMGDVRYRTFARRLVKNITPAQIQHWRDDEVINWAIDSYWRARKEAYRWTDGSKLPFKWARPGMDLTRDNYIDSHLPVVKGQLEKAGVRLAHLLNTALDQDYIPPAYESVKKCVEHKKEVHETPEGDHPPALRILE